MNSQDLTAQIVGEALAVGFDTCGVAAVEQIEAAPRLRQWLADGMHGSMAWIERSVDKRTDPCEVVPGARSVLLATSSYFVEDEPSSDPARACISRYAWGEEYHEVLGGRMQRLYERVQELVPAVQGRWYVDTGPVLEKAWAERAGLGWIGKHTNLIDERCGSWFFLAALVLDVELQPGVPPPDRCGSRTACIDVCPTDAIVAPYVLDARRCISYLTIENRGPIPMEYRDAIGNRVFGCDDCQEVCPWNRYATLSHHAQEFAPRPENHQPWLADLLELSQEQFSRRFRRSPIKRAKRAGLLRNVAVALGNSGDREQVQPLLRALTDSEPLVRGHAAWALGKLGGDAARNGLHEAANVESDDYVAGELRAALQASGRAASGPC